MRREPIILRQELLERDSRGAVAYRDLTTTGGEQVDTRGAEDELGGVETGRGDVRVRIHYTPGIAEIEDMIDAAYYRGRDWNVVDQDRDHFRMTLGLVRT